MAACETTIIWMATKFPLGLDIIAQENTTADERESAMTSFGHG